MELYCTVTIELEAFIKMYVDLISTYKVQKTIMDLLEFKWAQFSLISWVPLSHELSSATNHETVLNQYSVHVQVNPQKYIQVHFKTWQSMKTGPQSFTDTICFS